MNTKERRLEERKFWIGRGYQKHVMPDLEFEYYTNDSENHYSIVGFSGTKGKPDFNYYFKTPEKRSVFLEERIERLSDLKKYRDERKKEAKENRFLTRAALCAKAIREELKQKYPGIKFKVTSNQNFAGGNSVHISWTDGPLYREIDSLLSKYEYGHFDGMQDLYEYSNVRNDIPQAKYVSCRREMSKETELRLKKEISEKWDVDLEDRNACFSKFNCDGWSVLDRAFNEEIN